LRRKGGEGEKEKEKEREKYRKPLLVACGGCIACVCVWCGREALKLG